MASWPRSPAFWVLFGIAGLLLILSPARLASSLATNLGQIAFLRAIQTARAPESGLWEVARTAFRQAQPADARTWRLARLEARRAVAGGDQDSAVEAFERAARAASGSAIASAEVADALAARGDYAAAIALWRTAGGAPLLATRGRDAARKSNWALAVLALRAARAARPGDAELAVDLGASLLASRQDLAEAEALLRYAASNGGAREVEYRAHLFLGRIHELRERWEDALAAYQAAVTEAPRNAEGYISLGRMLATARGDLVAASAAISTAVRLSPKDANAYLALGNVYRRSGDIVAAASAYQTAANLDRRNPWPQLALVELQIDGGDRAGAVRSLEQLADVFPGEPHIYYLLAFLHLSLDNARLAVEPALRAVALAPTNAGYQLVAGRALALMGDRDGSLKAHCAALRLNPGHAQALAELGGLAGDCSPDKSSSNTSGSTDGE